MTDKTNDFVIQNSDFQKELFYTGELDTIWNDLEYAVIFPNEDDALKEWKELGEIGIVRQLTNEEQIIFSDVQP